MKLKLGIKSDPIEYRYSFPWLFRLMAEEGITSLQLGTFFELYQLPDDYFLRLRKQAEDFGIAIDSLFTAHRELGGFFREDPEWVAVANKNYQRLIQIGGILGAKSVGSNPGALPRDLMGLKKQGIQCYLRHMKELMHYAKEQGVGWLTIEPMSCLAEPPTLPEEMAAMAEELHAYHQEHRESTARVGYCTDIAHGYLSADESERISHVELFKASLPWLYEVHLKNTDNRFNSTFGFEPDNVERGIVDAAMFRGIIEDNADLIPVDELACYLEIGGPKLGRDYTDGKLEAQLRDSIQYLKQHFLHADPATEVADSCLELPVQDDERVYVSPSMMCVDPLNFENALRRLEVLGVDMLHLDIMDGHFVPNAPMGLGVLEALCERTHLPIDVHLMVENNDFFIGLLQNLNIHQISVHEEACPHLDRTLSRIREMGAKAGVALNPSTPLSALDFILDRIDYVLLMTVNPGFAGQKMTPASIRKIKDCRDYLNRHGYSHIPIQVDGNVSFGNIPEMVAAGAQNLVAGTSSIFNAASSWKSNLERTREAIRAGLARRDNQVLT